MKIKKVFRLLIFFSILIIMNLLVFAEVENQLSDTNKLEEAALIKAGTYAGSLGEKQEGGQRDNEDYYSIEVEEGQLIILQLTIPGNANYQISLLNPNKNSRGSSITQKDSRNLDYVADSTGTWYIKINRVSGEGEYQLSVDIKNQDDAVSGKDAGKSVQEAIPLSPGTITGFLKAGDNEDYYSIKVEEGQLIILQLTIPGNANYQISLLNPNKNSRGSASTEKELKTLDYVADSTGTWYIKIYRSSGEGEYQLSINISAGETAGDTTTQLVARFTYVSIGSSEENNFSFDGSSSNGPSTITDYEWDFGDGSATEVGEQVDHKFATPGTYQVTLTVVDQDSESAKETQSLDTTVPTLTASFTASTNETGVLEIVKFDASASQGSRPIEKYDWNFGDGSEEGNGVSVEHSFTDSGAYTVKLTVTDDSGATSTNFDTVTVLTIDDQSFVQCGIIQAGGNDSISFRAAFSGQPVVLTSAVVDGNRVVVSSPIEITPTNFTIVLTDPQENPISSALVHWIAFVPNPEKRCLGGQVSLDPQGNAHITFDSAINLRESETIVVVTNAVKTEAYISSVSNVTENGFDLQVVDSQGSNVFGGEAFWMAVVPGDENGFQGKKETLNHGATVTFDPVFDNPPAFICCSSTPGIIAGASNSSPEQVTINLSVDQAEINWLAYGGGVPSLQPGQIEVSSTPTGAKVYVEGSYVGITPEEGVLEVPDLMPGRYTVKLQLQDYNDYEETVTVSPTETITINPTLHTTPGTIVVSSDPSGATIMVDGASSYPFYWDEQQGWVNPLYGTTLADPVKLTPIPPGEHTLTLTLENYATWSETYQLVPGGTWTINAIFVSEPGTLSVTSTPSGATIYLAEGDQTSYSDDGVVWVEKGVTPSPDLFSNPVPLVLNNIAPGQYTVKCVLDYYKDALSKVEVNSNQTTEVDLDLTPARGAVKVIAQDEQGTSIPDAYFTFTPCFGEGCGQGPTDAAGVLEGTVNAGTYTIRVWKQNYTDYTEEIEVTAYYTSEAPLAVTAILSANPGSINVTSNPSGAMVYLAEGDQTSDSEDGVDWVEKGVTPLTITGIAPGTYTLKLLLAGYLPDGLSSEIDVPVEGYPFKTVITVAPGGTSSITANFTPMTGTIKVTSNEQSAIVFIDDENNGAISNVEGEIYSRLFENIPTGTHIIRVTKNGFVSYQTNCEVSYQETVTIQANLYQVQQLTAFITMTPSYGRPPLEVSFTGAGAGPAGTTIVSYHWDFGDGASSQEQNPTHTYSDVGQYEVKLTVTDNNGQTAFKEVGINVMSSDQREESPPSGCLKIFADSATVPDGEITYSGNVRLNGFLGVTGTITVQDGPDGEITGSGYLKTGKPVIDSIIANINNGESFIIAPSESDVGGCYRELTGSISSFSFSYYGLRFEARDPKLYNDRLSLAGRVASLGGILPAAEVGLSVSPSGLDFGGRIELPDFNISGFGIKDVFLELDLGCGNCWGAGITFELPPGVGIDVGGELGIQNGTIDRVSAKAASLGLPIGNSGVFLDSIDGGLEHIPPDPEPLVLKAGAEFYAGPKIPIPSFDLFNGRLKLAGGDLNLLGGDIDLTFDCGGKMTAEGVAYILDKDFGEIGNAGLTVDLNRGFYVWGEVKNPPGDFAILVGNLAGKLDFDLEFQASVSGTLQVPDSLPIIGGLHFGQAVGYIDNDLIAVGVSVGDTVCVPILGCADLSLDVCLIFSFDDPGFSVATNWDAIEEVELTSTPQGYTWGVPDELPLLSLASSIGTPLRYAGLGTPSLGQPQTLSASYSTVRANSLTEQGFEIPEGLAVTIFYMQLISEGVPPKFMVTTPEGIEYSEGSNEVIWQRNDIAGDLWCAVPNPKPGRWTVTPDPSLSGAEYKITTYRMNEKPALTITSPKEDIIVEAGTNVTINWLADDPDDTASIRLCYTESPLTQEKSNLPAWPGSTMVKNLSEENLKRTYSWSTKGVAPGKYYIYGVITDGKNFPVFAWSEGSVTVQRKDFSPPKGVKAHQDGSTVQVEWDSVPDAAGYRVYYQDIKETTPLVLASSQAVWEDTNTELGHLQPGVTYRITVTAFQEDDLESDYSKLIEVSYK
jgi:PKD repeat protein